MIISGVCPHDLCGVNAPESAASINHTAGRVPDIGISYSYTLVTNLYPGTVNCDDTNKMVVSSDIRQPVDADKRRGNSRPLSRRSSLL